jgi:hypothetical protein
MRYQRRKEDKGPEHECPRCGVIYEKFKQAHARPADTPPHRDIPAKTGGPAALGQDGQATLAIKDRKLQPSGQPLVFTLAQNRLTRCGLSALPQPDTDGVTVMELAEYKDPRNLTVGVEET